MIQTFLMLRKCLHEFKFFDSTYFHGFLLIRLEDNFSKNELKTLAHNRLLKPETDSLF